jgi:probable F420-dependent oxidoreductase
MARQLLLQLTENWTITDPADMRALVRYAVDAEEAGFDGVVVNEHLVMGASANADGAPFNPREYLRPGIEDPETSWPSTLVLLGAIAAATSRLRLVCAALLAPLRHPLVLAKEIATLDLLCGGRLTLMPSVGWQREEYDAMGIEFERRGEMMDEILEIWAGAWRQSPITYRGRHYAFDEVWFEPKPCRAEGPTLWFGGGLVAPVRRRLVRYGSGHWGLATPDAVARLHADLRAAGREPRDLEMVAALGMGMPFDSPTSLLDLDSVLAPIPELEADGVTTFVVKPSQLVDDAAAVGDLCGRIVDRVSTL